MENNKMKIEILEGTAFRKADGTFDKEAAILYCGKIAGVCYNRENFEKLKGESEEVTMKRVKQTLGMGHHSVYDHVLINFNIENIPKILAMVINNEKQYTTSEKSARYTPIVRSEGSIITIKEEELYNKWMNIFKEKIKEYYLFEKAKNNYLWGLDIEQGNNKEKIETKIEKLAQENSRYLVTVFAPTQMIYSTTFRQINYLASWMKAIIKERESKLIDSSYNQNTGNFIDKIIPYMKEFLNSLEELNIFEDRLQNNEKSRNLSLFSTNPNKEIYFGDVYSTNYKGSFAQLAQAHRHRTLSYEMILLENQEFFIPPIIEMGNDISLVKEWNMDIKSVANVNPQGEMVFINEQGTYDNFILKCKERFCSSTQLEICNQAKKTLEEYKNKRPDLSRYSKGARCTFLDYECTSDCKFKDGKILTRKI